MASILTPEFSEVTRGLPGSEGPVFTADGRRFFAVAPEEVGGGGEYAGKIYSVEPDTGKKQVLCAPSVEGYGGIPAGCQLDRQNQLWVADMRLGLLKVGLNDGSFQQVAASDSEGRVVQGCNDCTFDYSGTLWVTAPAGKIAPHPYTRSQQEAFGSLYSYTPEGGMIRVDTGYLFPNGIAVHHLPDGRPRTLIVAETQTKTLWAFDIDAPGKVSNKRAWAKIPGEHEGGPDGMDFDEEGNLLVANWGSSHLEVFGPSGGEPLMRIKCPFQKPSNLHFKPDTRELFVTEHENNAIWRTTWEHAGRKEYCQLMLF